jgi:hypothetical protein
VLLVAAGCSGGSTAEDRERLEMLEQSTFVSDPPAPLAVVRVNSDVGTAVFQNRTRSTVQLVLSQGGLTQPEAAELLAEALEADGWLIGSTDCSEGKIRFGAGKDFGTFEGMAALTGTDEGGITLMMYAPGADDPPYRTYPPGTTPPVTFPSTC